jgi:hypothetical protein
MARDASAQGQADCEAGITLIRQLIESASNPEQRERLKEALTDAERELGEREFEECLELVEDAREESEKPPR